MSFQQTDINVICFTIPNHYIKIEASAQNERKRMFNLHYDGVAEPIWGYTANINDNWIIVLQWISTCQNYDLTKQPVIGHY